MLRLLEELTGINMTKQQKKPMIKTSIYLDKIPQSKANMITVDREIRTELRDNKYALILAE